jgi:hypothetical protein
VQSRIEKDCVKSTLSYEKKGEVITEDVLLKRSKMPLVGDWGRIYPPLNEDGSWNVMNTIFGGKKNLIKLVLIFIILGLLYWQVSNILGANAEYMDGNKYVIISKGLFSKYCSAVDYTNSNNLINAANMTIFKEIV